MNICPKCLSKNPACANWCENCGEMLLPDAQPKPEKPRAFFKEYLSLIHIYVGSQAV